MIKGILNGKGSKTDLVLTNVVVVEGFLMNIVSEALLVKIGVWYHRYNGTLRMGDEHENSILLKTTRAYNVVFIKYKSLLIYLNTSSIILISISILIYPMLKRKVRESFKRSKKYL
jgi:hypothetical protein